MDSVDTSRRSNAVDQTNLLVVAMAERCLKIIQDKPADVRFGLPESLRPDHLRRMCNQVVKHLETSLIPNYIAGSVTFGLAQLRISCSTLTGRKQCSTKRKANSVRSPRIRTWSITLIRRQLSRWRSAVRVDADGFLFSSQQGWCSLIRIRYWGQIEDRLRICPGRPAA